MSPAPVIVVLSGDLDPKGHGMADVSVRRIERRSNGVIGLSRAADGELLDCIAACFSPVTGKRTREREL